MGMHRDRYEGREREREYDDRYRERYQTRDEDDGDRERRFGRFGRWDEDRGRDDERMRYQGWGGQSGSQSGNMSGNMYREQTGYRGDEREQQWGRGQEGRTWGTGGQQGYYGQQERQRGYGEGGGMYGQGQSRMHEPQGGMYGAQRGMSGEDRDYGGTLGHVDRPYAQQRGSQYGTSGPFGGGHRGKGPSGYTRSDDRIREDVNDALMDDDNVDASNIDVSVKNGEVTLSGTVTDRRSKRMAEDCIEHVRGVKDVINNIRVQQEQPDQRGGNGGGRMHSQSVSNAPDKDTDNGKRPRA